MIPRLTLHTDNSNNKLNLGSDKYLRGDDGKSAYEIWLEEGNVGTEEDFLNSLKGKDGKDGHTPEKGTDYWTETDKAEIVADVTEEMDSKGYVSADLTEGEESGVPATVNADTLGGYTLNDVVNKAKPTQAEIATLIPTASATVKGGVKVGNGLAMNGDVLSVDEMQWVCLESGTFAEDTLVFERTAEPNGTLYNLKALKVITGCPPGQTTGTLFLACFDETNKRFLQVGTTQYANPPTATSWYRSTALFQLVPFAGVYYLTASSGTQGGIQTVVSPPNGGYSTVSTDKHIVRITLSIYDDIPLIAGTEYQIWGVRA